MALIKLGGLAQDVRGSLNGTTFSRNKGGAFVRTKVSPVQPRTAAQLAVRENLSQGAKNWSGLLTDEERSQWSGFASSNTRTNVFGDTTHLSALQWYVGLNQVLVQIGQSRITTPPVDLGVPANRVIDGALVDTSGAVSLNSTAGTVGTGVEYYIFATPGYAPGKTAAKNMFRFLATASVGTSTINSVVNLDAAYAALFGTPIEGKKVSFLVSNVNTASGATTVGQKFETTVVPPI